MKIIHIIEATATGTLSMCALLANAQSEQGMEVIVVFSRRPETPKNIEEIINSNIKLIEVNMYGRGAKLFSLAKLRCILKEEEPDVVFMHSSFAGFLGRIAGIAILPKSRFFYIPHCISFMRGDIGRCTRAMFVLFEQIGSLKKSEYIACSESEQLAIKRRVPFRPCHLIENAISPLKKKANRPEVGSRKIVTIGQIRPQKGPLDFAKIAREVNNLYPNIEFIWIGDGIPEVRTELERAGVQVTGWLPREDVLHRLRSAHFYLSTALWEGMPVSIIEAIYTGLPIIASACPGNVDVVEDGVTGWLYNNPEEAVQQLCSLLSSPDVVDKIIEAAAAKARKRFDRNRYLRKMKLLTQ